MSTPLKFLNALIASSSSQSLRNRLIRSTSGTLGLRIFSMGLKFLTGILLARLLGVRNYGAYTFALSWLTVLTLFMLLGLDRLLQRQVAYFKVQENWAGLKGIWRFSWQISLGLSLLCVAGLLVSNHLLAAPVALPFLTPSQFQVFQPTDTITQQTIMIAFLALPFMVLTKLCLNTMQGLQQVVRGQIPEFFIQPLLFIVLVAIIYLLTGHTNAPTTMLVWGAVMVVVALYALWQVQHVFPEPSKTIQPLIEWRRWLRQGVPLFALSLLTVVRARADFILVGLLQSIDAVALYGVAFTLAGLVTLVLSAAGSSLSPTFATLYAEGDIERLEKLVVKSSRAILLASLPIVVGLAVFGKIILSLYGPDYQAAYPALLVMLIGQFINMGSGSVGTLLTMTGHETYSVIGQTVGVIVYLLLLFLLIPPLGILGAAIATTVHIITWNALLMWFAWRQLGIVSSALGRLRWGVKR